MAAASVRAVAIACVCVCAQSKSGILTIGASGDFFPNGDMMKLAFAKSDGYQSLFLDDTSALIHVPDFFFANLETAAAECVSSDWKDVGIPCPMEHGENNVYSVMKWSHNNHPRVAQDMVALGMDVVALANNHIFDRGPLGVARTIDALDDAGLAHVGAHNVGEQDWFILTKKKGWNIAWVACTEHLTDKKATNDPVQVMFCDDDRFIPLITKLSERKDVDAVIVSLHWGKIHKVDVYETTVTKVMKDFARSMVDAGASAVICAHPHVLMGWESYASGGRDGLILYSLGNMVAAQGYSDFSLQRCQKIYKRHRTICKRLLLSKVFAYFALKPHASGKASAYGFKYLVTTWDGERMGLTSMPEPLAAKSWAAEVLGEEHRLPGRPAKWYRSALDTFCFPLVHKDLPDVGSVQECMALVEKDVDCGTTFATNGTLCRCVRFGERCQRRSRKGFILYDLKQELPGSWKIAHRKKYCGNSSNQKDLRQVVSEQDCMGLARADPDCGDILISNGKDCSCMAYEKTCELESSTNGKNVYKWTASSRSAWVPLRTNMYCGINNRKNLLNVTSVSDCQSSVDADPQCGDYFISDGRLCRCILAGNTNSVVYETLPLNPCDYHVSTSGSVVYKHTAYTHDVVTHLEGLAGGSHLFEEVGRAAVAAKSTRRSPPSGLPGIPSIEEYLQLAP